MINAKNLIEIDRLALDARTGAETAINELCKHYLPIIEKLSKSIWYKLANEASFECYCILKIKNALRKFDVNKGNFDYIVRRSLKESVNMFISRGRNKRSPLVSLEKLHNDFDDYKEDNNKTSTTDLPDKLSVEDVVQTQEIVSTLAGGDEKKKFVLTCWSDGLYNDSEIAKLVAQRFEGVNPKSYRITIQRFREYCKSALSKLS